MTPARQPGPDPMFPRLTAEDIAWARRVAEQAFPMTGEVAARVADLMPPVTVQQDQQGRV